MRYALLAFTLSSCLFSFAGVVTKNTAWMSAALLSGNVGGLLYQVHTTSAKDSNR